MLAVVVFVHGWQNAKQSLIQVVAKQNGGAKSRLAAQQLDVCNNVYFKSYADDFWSNFLRVYFFGGVFSIFSYFFFFFLGARNIDVF